MLAEIKRIYTAPYCAIVTWYCSSDRTPSHSYVLVTGMFWNVSRTQYICICATYFLYLYISEIFLTLLSSSLVVRWLENWRWNMYYLGLTHLIVGSAPSCNPTIAYLLPVCVCQFRVRSWRCDMYYCGRPIYTIPEYISRKMKASPNILYNDYGVTFTFSCIFRCLPFTFCLLNSLSFLFAFTEKIN